MSGLAVRDDAAALALVESAEQVLALVESADQAEELWRKVTAVEHAARLAKLRAATQLEIGRLKLRAERKWGQLLGPATVGENQHTSSGLPAGKATNADWKARHKARQVFDVDEVVFERYLEGCRDPESLRRARLLRVAREAAAEERRAELVEPVTEHGEIEIRHGNLRIALNDLEGQVDAIITDPPYPAKFIDEFDALGQVAARLLKPDGLLVAMTGQAHLPAYLERLTTHLTYRWCGAYLTDGPATRIHGRAVGTKWKPLLIFGGKRFITQDVFRSGADDKRHHEWGQSESGIAELVERLTEPGELVVDPFLGGGTTAIVCKELGRRFIGCDVDAAAVSATRERLAA